MRRTFVLLAVLMASTGVLAQAGTISLNVAGPVQAGSPFDVNVWLTDAFSGRLPGDLIEAYGFNVFVGDNSIFQYTGETAGSLFYDLSGFSGGPMVAGFAIDLAGIGPSDLTEPLTLATLHFTALQHGTTTIGVDWDPVDPNQGLVYAFLPYGGISASASVATPEPGTLALLGAGLAVVVLVRRRLADRYRN